ncbi:hypothetical protein [Rhizobium alvei]|uniref:Uncharacterized protein n=1 Tax=Rhizobium alvei TaxID=1132659 RepID=A0ABT8YUH6_9HYPH|nr:hypothetical protein [Rhizobium alvei]MDO6966952.1 hypothetical protein [Rhizobium alvei]
MNTPATIEQEFDLATSRIEVFAVEILNEIDIPEEQFDRAVMFDVERQAVRGSGHRVWGEGA